MIELIEILTAQYSENSRIEMSISVDFGYGPETIPYTYDPIENVGLNPDVTSWLIEHPAFVISPFVSATLEEQKEIKIQAVKDFGDVILHSGFPFNSGVEYGLQHLQLRDTVDRTNWLTSQAAYQAQVMLGGGALVEARFRTAENNTILMSYQDAWMLLLQMAGWGAHLFSVSWTKQDAIRAATTQEEFDAIIVEDNWLP